MIYGCLKNAYIKHKHAKDVCYYVKDVRKYGSTYKYRLEIWNMGFENSWRIDECVGENLDLANFQYLAGEKKDCLRYANWLDIQS